MTQQTLVDLGLVGNESEYEAAIDRLAELLRGKLEHVGLAEFPSVPGTPWGRL